MKRRTEKWMNWIAAIVLLSQVVMVVALFSLRPARHDLFENGTLNLETEAESGTRLPHAHADIRGESLRVQGRIRLESDTAASERSGTIVVVIVLPDKSELGRVTVPYHLSAKLPKGGGGFSVNFPAIPPPGSLVRIRWEETTSAGRNSIQGPTEFSGAAPAWKGS